MSEIQERREMIAKVHEREKTRTGGYGYHPNRQKYQVEMSLMEADDIFIQEEKRNVDEEIKVITEQLARINGSDDRTMMDKLARFAISEIKFIKEKKLRDLNVLGLETDKVLKYIATDNSGNRKGYIAETQHPQWNGVSAPPTSHAAGAASAGGGRKKRRTKRRTNRRTKHRKTRRN